APASASPSAVTSDPSGIDHILPQDLPTDGGLPTLRGHHGELETPATLQQLAANEGSEGASVPLRATRADSVQNGQGLDPKPSPISDASEGGESDPLLNKTWDLTSPKSVTKALER